LDFQVTASGGISQSAVDKTTVDAYVRASDGVAACGALLSFAAGAGLSTALALASTVKHPTILYLALAVEGALIVAFALGLRRELRERDRSRERLDGDTTSMNFLITPSHGTSISGAPASGPAVEEPPAASSDDS
jgi:hypothetical protein